MPLLPVATGLLVVALLWAEGSGRRWGVILCKPLASAGFVGYAVAGGAGQTPYGGWVLTGLLLCWAGDVLLIPRSPGPFKAGLVSFLLGHLAFGGAFLAAGVDPGWTLAAGLFLAVVAWRVGRWLLPAAGATWARPLVAYMVAISAMAALGAGAFGLSRRPLLLIAPLAFFVSDLAVARDRFVRPGFINRLWGLPLYYAAQLLFAASAAAGRAWPAP